MSRKKKIEIPVVDMATVRANLGARRPPQHRVRVGIAKTKAADGPMAAMSARHESHPVAAAQVQFQSEYERKIQASRDAEAFNPEQLQRASQSIVSDPCDRILEGVKFRESGDRLLVGRRIRDHVNQEVAIARIEAEVRGENIADKLNHMIDKLRNELILSHRRHAEDVIEAHGASEMRRGALCHPGMPR